MISFGQNTPGVWAALRAERDARLAACDWTMVVDAPVNKRAWKAYRQALRDITDTATPHRPDWPIPPE